MKQITVSIIMCVLADLVGKEEESQADTCRKKEMEITHL
jgi:hypothetical protein